MKVIGQYNKSGYNVDLINSHGERMTYYTAGNSPFDSQQYVENGLPLETIKQYCELTSKDIAAELNGEFLGVELIED